MMHEFLIGVVAVAAATAKICRGRQVACGLIVARLRAKNFGAGDDCGLAAHNLQLPTIPRPHPDLPGFLINK